MKRIANYVKGTTQQNPFSDSQARNFSDTKIINEFCPISNFWSLFNDQHEVLLGTRGSGKTFLLKMMRYSMLKHIEDPKAKQLSTEKKFIALYVPMYLEFVTHLTNSKVSEEVQIKSFQFAFNCLLAQSLLVELKEIISEEPNKIEWAKTNLKLSMDLNSIWFNDDANDVSDLFSLNVKLKKLFYTFDVNSDSNDDIPPVFKRQIGSSLLAVKEVVSKHIGLTEDPTWIICIDEAEFLSEAMQKCINSIFRSDSNRIALKVATLPYYHRTLVTLNPAISVSSGNDFSYRVVDMKYTDDDFINLTNSLTTHRLKSRFNDTLDISQLEDFLGKYGNDKQIDYYREEVGEELSSYDRIVSDIIENFSAKRKQNASSYTNKRKTIYDKFTPIFYVREMYKLSKQGNRVPGWYAGSQMVRKISQGNPRAFIQIMNNLFEKARKNELTPKVQHGVLMNYVNSFCESTQALENNGPIMFRQLENISNELHKHVHRNALISAGCNFSLSFDKDESFDNAQNWLQQAVAYSRITVDEDTLKNGIKTDTEFVLSNTYAAKYWLPMRSDISPLKIHISNNQEATYTVKVPSKYANGDQMTFFEEAYD